MATSSDVHERLDRLSVDMQARDEGLRRAFQILTDALIRMQAAMDDNREDSVIVVSHGAEKQDVCGKRPFGDPWITMASETEMRAAIMENMGSNLSRQVEKPLAVDFLDGAMRVFHGSVGAHRAAWHRSETAYAQSRKPDLMTVFENKRELSALVSLLEAIKASTITARLIDLLRDEAGGIPRRDIIMPPSDARLEFAEHLRREGFELRGEPIMDGKWRHARVGDEKKPSGRYRGFLDERPSGQYIRSKQDDRAKTWTPDRPLPPPTPEERQRFAERQAARDAERKAAEIKAGKRAFAIWTNAPDAREHAYLDRKGVGAHGLKLDDTGNLLVPMADTGNFLRNIQTIAPDGTKLYQKDARKTGLFATLGKIDPSGPLLIAEGFATAASLREATGLPVIAAFEAGNLRPVAEALRQKYPAARLILAADNDHHLPRRPKPLPNVGKEKAEAAALAVSGMVIMPVFAEVDASTDWNDFAQTRGKAALRVEVDTQLEVHGIELPATGPVTQQQRDAARERHQAAPAMGNYQAVEQARQLELGRQQAEQRHHNRGPSP